MIAAWHERAAARIEALDASSVPSVMGQTQRFVGPCNGGVLSSNREVYVENRDTANRYRESQATFDWHPKAHSLDVTIEEQVGTSRRTKHTSFRVEEPAARALYALLHEHFGSKA